MNQRQKKNRERRLHRLEKEREFKKVQESEEEADSELDVPEREEVQKETKVKEAGDGIYVGGMMPFDTQPPAISFAELDENKVAEDEAHAVMEVTCDAETLVRNILHDPDMEPSEKASAIGDVADEFAARVATEIEDEQKEVDLDLLQLEAVIAHDRRSTNALEYLEDITKRVLSSASRNSLDDSKFALVRGSGNKKVRKYPIHDKAHVRNALARAAQMIKRGGSAAADARAALPKIHAAAKRMGIGSSTSKERNAILIQKDASNQWRWVGWVSNNFIDWDGDIIAEDAHKEYVDWLDKNMDMAPASLSWHMPETVRQSPVDFAMYENGFLIMSGQLLEKEAAALLELQSQVDLGMSHGTFVLSRDPKDTRIITKYRMYEVSDLPLMKAANPFTDFEAIAKEVNMDKAKYLATILGEEKAAAFLEKTGLKNKILKEAEVEHKEKEEEILKVDTPPTPESKVDAPVATTIVNNAPTDSAAILAQVMKELDIEGLNAFVVQAKEAIEKVPVLEALVKDLQGKKDDQLAEMLTPKAAKFAWSQANRPSADESNVVAPTEKEKNQPGVPEEYWLSKATGTAPIKAQ